VVIVEVDAVRAEVGEVVDGVHRVEGGAHLEPERVPAPVADRPQAEGEVVLGSRDELTHRGPALSWAASNSSWSARWSCAVNSRTARREVRFPSAACSGRIGAPTTIAIR